MYPELLCWVEEPEEAKIGLLCYMLVQGIFIMRGNNFYRRDTIVEDNEGTVAFQCFLTRDHLLSEYWCV